MAEIVDGRHGWRMALAEVVTETSPQPSFPVYTADTIYEWSDTIRASRYSLRLYPGVQMPTLETIPFREATLDAAAVASKSFRLGDIVASWLPTGWYTIAIIPTSSSNFGSNSFYVE